MTHDPPGSDVPPRDHCLARAAARLLSTGAADPQPPDLSAGGDTRTTVTYLGHATVLVEARGTRLVTDPVLRRRVGHLRRVAPLPRVAGIDAPDGVLVSHAHLDHLDLPSLRNLAPSTSIVVPRGLARTVRRAGPRRIIEVEAGDRVTVGDVDVLVTPAEHDGRRLPLSRAQEAVGYVIEGPQRVYFAGDTDLFEGMADLAGDLALALLPVWGWGRKVGRGHLDPERAARAAAVLRPRFAVPIHWGTLAAPRAALSASAWPAQEFARLTATSAPEVDVRVLGHGEALVLVETPGTA